MLWGFGRAVGLYAEEIFGWGPREYKYFSKTNHMCFNGHPVLSLTSLDDSGGGQVVLGGEWICHGHGHGQSITILKKLVTSNAILKQ
jgi:hypothetical protein